MNIKKFFAKNSREALKQIKRALGDEAVILSNRQVTGGVELLAVAGSEAQALVSEATHSPTSLRPAHAKSLNPVRKEPLLRGGATAAFQRTSDKPAFDRNSTRAAVASHAGLQLHPATHRESAQEMASDVIAHQVISEIKAMRGAIESQLYGLVWSDLHKRDPGRAVLLRDLLTSGFSPRLARDLVGRLPSGNANELYRWAKKALIKNLGSGLVDEIVMRGGVYALTGPTGVGKTTTTAKLAARCVVRHGADKVALLTTDSYRVGAYEHLKIYGRILGVSVHAARDQQDLASALATLRDKHIVLIDTIGMSQRDKLVADQIAMLAGTGNVQRLLLLNATCHGDTLEDVVRVYGGSGLTGCILTKVDEAPAIGAALDLIIRHKMKLQFVSNGQRVPEDLHPVNKDYLVDRALRRGDAPLDEQGGEEMAVLMAGARAANAA